MNILWIGLGGFAGTIARYAVGQVIAPHEILGTFPISTFLVNIAGSLLLGFVVGASSEFEVINTPLKQSLTIGFCGAFTTFSTFMLESFHLAKENEFWLMALYFVLSILFGFLALLIGWLSGKYIAKFV